MYLNSISDSKVKWVANNLSVLADPFIPTVLIKPGMFLMGSPDLEGGRFCNEQIHEVTLTQCFFMAETTCTQTQWLALMGSNPSYTEGADLPVEMVTWREAVVFCQKLTNRHQKGGSIPENWAWRLPTEAEWEYTARAETAGPRHGDLDTIAWHDGNAGGRTHPVKQKAANAWGLHDMIGNVWEWCSDWQDGYSSSAVIDPIGPSSGKIRVRRGGSWGYEADICRSAYRSGLVPGACTGLLGFRPVLSFVR